MDSEVKTIKIGTGELLREGTDVTLIAIGSTVYPALHAAELLAGRGISAGVINARFVKPLDSELIRWAARQSGRIVTVEENALQGGFGSAVLELLYDSGLQDVNIRRLGLPDHFIEQGSQAQLRKITGIDAEGITSAVLEFMK